MDGVALWGSEFVAAIDFSDALEGAGKLNTAIAAIPSTVKSAVDKSIEHLSRLQAKLSEVGAAAAGIGFSGVLGGGGGTPPAIGPSMGGPGGGSPGPKVGPPHRTPPKPSFGPGHDQLSLFSPDDFAAIAPGAGKTRHIPAVPSAPARMSPDRRIDPVVRTPAPYSGQQMYEFVHRVGPLPVQRLLRQDNRIRYLNWSDPATGWVPDLENLPGYYGAMRVATGPMYHPAAPTPYDIRGPRALISPDPYYTPAMRGLIDSRYQSWANESMRRLGYAPMSPTPLLLPGDMGIRVQSGGVMGAVPPVTPYQPGMRAFLPGPNERLVGGATFFGEVERNARIDAHMRERYMGNRGIPMPGGAQYIGGGAPPMSYPGSLVHVGQPEAPGVTVGGAFSLPRTPYVDAMRTWADMSQNVGRLASPFRYRNLHRIASGLYIGRTFMRSVGALSDMTIGSAAQEQEGRTLLAQSLAGGAIGMSMDEAQLLADRLVEAQYLTGMSMSARQLGLSRAELAEQYRQLAPIVRLHADDPITFAEGLERGSIARQLLVARDPVQGTRGASVALSELYAGGSDRFRSLAMRFELPRSRMMELEAERTAQAGGASYDPALIIIDLLEEMGIGPDYLEARARQTLPGQVDRTRALFADARIDVFQSSLHRTIDNIARLNDAMELWANSDAYDAVIDKVDSFLGGVASIASTPFMNYLSSSALAGGSHMSLMRTGGGALDMLEHVGDQFWLRDRTAGGGARAFGEAAAEVLVQRAGMLLHQAAPNMGMELGVGTTRNLVVSLLAGTVMNRLMFGGQGGNIISGAMAAPVGTRLGTLGRGLGGAFMRTGLPLLATVGGSGLVAGARMGIDRYDMLANIPAEYLAEEAYWNAGGGEEGERAAAHARRRVELSRELQDASPLRRGWYGFLAMPESIRGALGINPAITHTQFDAETARSYMLSETISTLRYLDPDISALPEAEQRGAVFDMLNAMNIEQEWGVSRGDLLRAVNASYQIGEEETRLQGLSVMLSGAAQAQMRQGEGFEVRTPDGRILGFSAADAPALMDDRVEFNRVIKELAQHFLSFADPEATANELLDLILGQIRGVKENTDEMVALLAPRFRLSEAPGLYYGYLGDPDYRNVGLEGSFSRPMESPSAKPGPASGTSGAGGAVPTGRSDLSVVPPVGGWVDSNVLTWTNTDYITSRPGIGNHAGVDLVSSDPNIYSFFDDPVTVTANHWSETGGNLLQVETASGNRYNMMHFASKPSWKVGDTIGPGELLGIQGTTGSMSSGDHLHLELEHGRSNPLNMGEGFYDTLASDASGLGGSTIQVGDTTVVVNVAEPNATPEQIAEAVEEGMSSHWDRMLRDGIIGQSIDWLNSQRRRKGETPNRGGGGGR